MWGGNEGKEREDAWVGQDGYRRKLSGGKTDHFEGGIGVELTRVEEIMVLNWGHSEMVVNSCLEDLDGRIRFKGMWKWFHRQEKRETNEWM